MTTTGNCHLCGKRAELQESHVWSRFAYKRYVSDQTKGGKFCDLWQMREHNAQYKRDWFCKDCEELLGKSEGCAAGHCDRLEKRPTEPFDYDEHLLRFATSISWRTAKMALEDEGPASEMDEVRPACKQWKDYLRGKRSSVLPFSQHLFVVFGTTVPYHHGLGGQVYPRESLTLSQIGPLFIVGLLSRAHLTHHDRKVWQSSLLQRDGGTVTPVNAWRVGTNVTIALARLLTRHESMVKKKTVEFVGDSRPKGRRPSA